MLRQDQIKTILESCLDRHARIQYGVSFEEIKLRIGIGSNPPDAVQKEFENLAATILGAVDEVQSILVARQLWLEKELSDCTRSLQIKHEKIQQLIREASKS